MEEFTLNVQEETLGGFVENPDVQIEVPPEPNHVNPTQETGSQEPILIGTIKSSAYGGLTKILSLLTSNMGKADVISIEEGKLSTISGGGFLYCDLSILFGANNFDIIDPQYSIKLMRLITGGDEVTFIDDEANARYLISNLIDGQPQINITLPKPDPSLHPTITKPNLGELQEKVDGINPDLVGTITAAEKSLDSQYFILEVLEDQETTNLVSISTDKEIFRYNFKEIEEVAEPVKYKLFNPFPIPKPDEIEFELFKSDVSELWVKTSSEVGMARIEYMEKLTKVGIFDSFSL